VTGPPVVKHLKNIFPALGGALGGYIGGSVYFVFLAHNDWVLFNGPGVGGCIGGFIGGLIAIYQLGKKRVEA
jgi:hypothetical protein